METDGMCAMVCPGACVEVSSPRLPLCGTQDGTQVSRLAQQMSLLLHHLFGLRTHFAMSQIPVATLAVSSTTCVCSSQWMVGTRKLFSICFLPCHLRMPLCQLCGSLYGNLHFASVTKGRAERMCCKYNKEQLIIGLGH